MKRCCMKGGPRLFPPFHSQCTVTGPVGLPGLEEGNHPENPEEWVGQDSRGRELTRTKHEACAWRCHNETHYFLCILTLEITFFKKEGKECNSQKEPP